MGKFIVKAVATAMLACVPMQGAAAPTYTPDQIVTIRGDRGGVMLKYALRVKKLHRRGALVRLGGRCDSACTLYLAMPSRQVCLLPGATFRFHLPYGSTGKNNRIAAQYMMRSYPSWVRSWINGTGGLTPSLKTMRYDYAVKYIKTCENNRQKKTRAQLVKVQQLGR